MASTSVPQPESFNVRCQCCGALLRGPANAAVTSHGLGPCCEDAYRAANGLRPRKRVA